MKKNIPALSKIEIKNFESLDSVTLDFDESPIISLVGTNGSGKTATLRAIRTLLINENPNKQARRVRTGTGGFGVRAIDTSGNYIEKIKYSKGNSGGSIYSGKVNGEAYSVNITTGIPEFVQEFSQIEPEKETKQVLQFRDHRSKLLFAETEASSNYRIFYNILNLQEITRAATLGQENVNGLKSELKALEMHRDRLLSKKSELLMKKRNVEPLKLLRDRIQFMMDNHRRLLQVNQDSEKVYQLKSSHILVSLQEISQEAITGLSLLDKTNKEISKSFDLSVDLQKNQSIHSLKYFSENDLIILELFYALEKDQEKLQVIQNKNRDLDRIRCLSEIDSFEALTVFQQVLPMVKEYETKNNKDIKEHREAVLQLQEQEKEKIEIFEDLLQALQRQCYLRESVGIDLSNIEELSEKEIELFDSLSKDRELLEVKKKTREEQQKSLSELKNEAPVLSCPNCGFVIELEL